jgi:hypothetical protein
MPPSGECPLCIAPVAAMVDDFEKKKKHYQNNFYLALSR